MKIATKSRVGLAAAAAVLSLGGLFAVAEPASAAPTEANPQRVYYGGFGTYNSCVNGAWSIRYQQIGEGWASSGSTCYRETARNWVATWTRYRY